jgi:5-methylcytosine-specific restriction enzyme subunit McrC
VLTRSESSLWVGEHGWILRGTVNRCLEGGNLELQADDFHSLEELLEDSRADEARQILPLNYRLRHGHPAFKVQNQVGLIRTGSGQQIEILPKISRQGSVEQSRRILIRMLVELKDSPFIEAVAADLDAHRMPLFELLMRYFLDQVAVVVRRGIARSYVQREGNLTQLRGKILVRENLRHNSANAARFYCQYEEFMADRPINRLIKSGLRITAGITRLPRSQQICRELLGWFEEVQAPSDWRKEFRHIHWDRNVRHYRKAIPPCRMLHERLNPLTLKGSNRAIAMLFPMERVFEDYVAACLRRQFPEIRVETQKRGRYLVDDHAGKPIFALRPDFVLTSGRQSIIADAKWKLIDQNDRANNYNISQADMYQLYAYSAKFVESPHGSEVWLIYPAHEQFKSPLPTFQLDYDSRRLKVLPFDLERGEVMLNDHSFQLR